VSYLLQHLRRPFSGGHRTARIDETTLLNLPEFDGGAHVRCFVEDTSQGRRGDARIKLAIADCVHEANLEFSLGSPQERENALYKVNTLVTALNRFRDALDAEAELAALRSLRKEA
jgi:hypothetical protein